MCTEEGMPLPVRQALSTFSGSLVISAMWEDLLPSNPNLHCGAASAGVDIEIRINSSLQWRLFFYRTEHTSSTFTLCASDPRSTTFDVNMERVAGVPGSTALAACEKAGIVELSDALEPPLPRRRRSLLGEVPSPVPQIIKGGRKVSPDTVWTPKWR